MFKEEDEDFLEVPFESLDGGIKNKDDRIKDKNQRFRDELPGQSSGVIKINDCKAGMEGIDIDKINRIICQTSEGSKFYEHKRKKKEKMEQKALEIKQLYDKLSPIAIKDAENKVDKLVAELLSNQDLTRIIVHIDMDCFFAAVEIRDNPKLKTEPVAVGGMSMLGTSNYIARKFGVRPGMPGFMAKKLCPNLIIIPSNFGKYSAAASLAHVVYKDYDPDAYCSMDEASLDLTQYIKTHLGEDEDEEIKIAEVVNEIREKVFKATNGLTCSAGISPNSFLSKICSDMNKPNGQYRLLPSSIPSFISSLKIRKVCGIGEATETLLRGLGINTCGELREKRGGVSLLFKPATADFLLRVSLGLGRVFSTFGEEGADERKSIGCERTFSTTSNSEALGEHMRYLCTELVSDLKSKGISGRKVEVKIKTHTFDVRTRVRSLFDYTQDHDTILRTALSIFESIRREQGAENLRLMGVKMSDLKFKNNSNPDDSEDVSSCHSTNIKSKNLLESFLVNPSTSSLEQKVCENSFECPVCNSTFGSLIKLKRHVEECLNNSEQSSQSNINLKCNNNKEASSFNTDKISLSDSKIHKTFDSKTKLGAKRIKLSESEGSSPSAKILHEKETIKMMPINYYFKNLKKEGS